MKTRASDQIFLITSEINVHRDVFIPLDGTFKPFDLPALLQENKFSSFSHDFVSITDPYLADMIREHQINLEMDENGKVIYLPDKQDLEDLTLLEQDDPLEL